MIFGTVSTPSDKRIKKNIVKIDHLKNEKILMQIELYNFEYVSTYSADNRTQMGVIAQQAIGVDSNLAGAEVKIATDKEDIMLLTVRYDYLAIKAIAQVQYLTQRTIALEDSNKLLQQKILEFEARFKLLEKG